MLRVNNLRAQAKSRILSGRPGFLLWPILQYQELRRFYVRPFPTLAVKILNDPQHPKGLPKRSQSWALVRKANTLPKTSPALRKVGIRISAPRLQVFARRGTPPQRCYAFGFPKKSQKGKGQETGLLTPTKLTSCLFFRHRRDKVTPRRVGPFSPRWEEGSV